MTQAPPSSGNQCAATRKNGLACSATPLPGSRFCFAHDPARAEQRDAARKRGGHNRSNVARLRGLMPARLEPVFNLLESALTEVHAGSLAPARATAMASVARALIDVYQAGELEDRVRRIEARAEAQEAGRQSWGA